MTDDTDRDADLPDDYDPHLSQSDTRPVLDQPDPAFVVADILLRTAIVALGHDVSAMPTSGSIVLIEVPEASWKRPVLLAWRRAVQHNLQAQDGYGGVWRSGSLWSSWCTDDAPARIALKRAADEFGQSVAAGRNCVGIAPADELDWLPSDLRLGADYRISVPVPSSAVLAAAAGQLTSKPSSVRLQDAHAALATPRLLRLAYRPGRQTGDDYLNKLRRMIAQEVERKPQKSGSPRHAPTLDRLHGMGEAVAWGLRLRDDLLAVKAGTLSWAELDRGCLLSGPPGCGKTTFARALAATCGIKLVSGSYSQWLGTGTGHQGDLLLAMRKSFQEARRLAPSILIIDEIDSFPNRQTVTHRHKDWEVQVVNALLAEIDGVELSEGVIVIGACNHPETLDPALTRSGRLDRHISIGLPNANDLALILREHLGSELMSADLRPVALWAAGSSGADCERYVREARQRARAAKRPLSFGDLETVVSGADRPGLAPDDLWLVCLHEAGHAVVAVDMGYDDIKAVFVGGAGEGILGRTGGWADKNFVTAHDVRTRVIVTLAGRAAEEVMLGRPSSVSGGHESSDLARATLLLLSSHAMLGLGQNMPPVWLGSVNAETMPTVLAAHPELAKAVKQEVAEAYEEVKRLVRRRRGAITKIAFALRESRLLDGAQIKAIADRYPASSPCDWQEPSSSAEDSNAGRD